MANPFETFRKHQAVMLVVFGVLIILVFTIGDSLTQMLGGGAPNRANPVVVTWVGGDLRQMDLESASRRRAKTAEVLRQVQFAALRKQNIPEQFWNDPRIARPLTVSQQELNNSGTMRHLMLVRKADELGIEIGDDQVNAYIDTLLNIQPGGPPVLDREELAFIIEGPPGKKHGSVTDFFLNLKEELKADEVEQRLMLSGFEQFTPGELLSFYEQLEKQVALDYIAIPVDTFVDQVSQPSNEELVKYFKKFKGILPGSVEVGGTPLPSPEPGFKRPYRATVEFIRCSFDDFVDRAREEIEKDEEKIKDYYESRKDTDINLQVPKDVTVDSDDAAAAEATPEDATEEKTEKSEAGESESDTSDVAKEKGPETASPQPDSESPTEGSEEAKEAVDTDDSGAAKAATEATLGTKDVEAAPAEKPAKSDDGPTDTTAETADATLETKDDPAAETEGSTVDSTADDTGDEKDVEDKGEDKEEDVIEYKPLDQVRDYIVLKLAEDRAPTLMDGVLDPLYEKMNEHFQYTDFEKIPDLAKIAEDTGLEVQRVGPMSAQEFYRNTEIGTVDGFLGSVFSQTGKTSLVKPGRVREYSNNNYLFWKVDEKPEAELTEEDLMKNESLHGEVVDAWKRGEGMDDASGKAQAMAMAAGEKLAKELEKGVPLDNVAAQQSGSRVGQTDLFSWYSIPTAPDPSGGTMVRLTSIEGVDSPGPEFMRAAFETPVDGVAVAMNHPRTVVYVLRVTRAEPSDEKLQADFLAEFKDQNLPGAWQQIARYDVQDTSAAWFRKLSKEFDVNWKDE